jgi:uncharacterized protein
MLTAWGGFIFRVRSFPIDQITRSTKSRIAPQPVIGARPVLHRLGPDTDTIQLQSTFMPMALNRDGLPMLSALEQAVSAAVSSPLVTLTPIAGRNIFGLWLAHDVSVQETEIAPNGVPQVVSATLSLMRDG